MSQTPLLAMPYLVASQAQKEVTHNEALNDLDCLTQATVISRGMTTPPSNPSAGDAYIVGVGASGAWTGADGALVAYYNGWRIKTPKAGWRVFCLNENKMLCFLNGDWAAVIAPALDATFSWTPGTLANNAGVSSQSVAVSSATFGDFVTVAAPYDLQGVFAHAYVSANNAVVVRLHNATGASVVLPSGTWRVRVHHQ